MARESSSSAERAVGSSCNKGRQSFEEGGGESHRPKQGEKVGQQEDNIAITGGKGINQSEREAYAEGRSSVFRGSTLHDRAVWI